MVSPIYMALVSGFVLVFLVIENMCIKRHNETNFDRKKQRITLRRARTIRVLISCNYYVKHFNLFFFFAKKYLFIYSLKLSYMHRYFGSSKWYERIYSAKSMTNSISPIFLMVRSGIWEASQ